MLDTRTQARLTQNYTDAAIGYANASAAAMNALTQQALSFWSAPLRAPEPARRDHLSWFNPNGTTSFWGVERRPEPVNPWQAFMPWAFPPAGPLRGAFQPPASAAQMQAMSWAFAPFAMWWGTVARGPTFAWPMAYSMIAQGVPDSVAWPTAQANAAVLDATATLTEHAQQTFASYQSAGGFAMAHVWSPKQALSAIALLSPMIAAWPGQAVPSAFF